MLTQLFVLEHLGKRNVICCSLTRWTVEHCLHRIDGVSKALCWERDVYFLSQNFFINLVNSLNQISIWWECYSNSEIVLLNFGWESWNEQQHKDKQRCTIYIKKIMKPSCLHWLKKHSIYTLQGYWSWWRCDLPISKEQKKKRSTLWLHWSSQTEPRRL